MDDFTSNYSHESGSFYQSIGLSGCKATKESVLVSFLLFQFTCLLDDVIIEGCHLISYVFLDAHELGVDVGKYIKVIHKYRASLCKSVIFSL